MYGPYWNYGDWPGPWHMMWGGFGWIFPLLMMALFVGVCVFLFTRMGGHGADRGGGALRILGERFAKGEIGQQEYEEKRAVLLRKP